MNDNLKAIMTENLGKLMLANAELLASNVTLTSEVHRQATEIQALKLEIEGLKNGLATD